ncbi:MAG: hypothetical protein Q7S06_02855 [Nanoarchaeota archaeon]|nr:hypothetical protein [Nanoarchaeota archaeon]
MTEKRMVLVLYETRAHNPFNTIKGLERFAAIADFNSRMAGNPAEVIRLHNRICEEDRQKHQLIETFINQLYGLIEIKKTQERKNY